MFPHFMIEEALNVTCRKDAKGFKDLHILPVSFGQKVNELVSNVSWEWNSLDETRRETENA